MKKYIMNNKNEMENNALQLKALLTVLSATDSDNKTALCEMPYALEIAVQMAEKLYDAIADAKEMEVK